MGGQLIALNGMGLGSSLFKTASFMLPLKKYPAIQVVSVKSLCLTDQIEIHKYICSYVCTVLPA